ncbi:DUF5684 domain-containing protein, partial [Akkermansiaceae bacterium]|nr:DUF5684 domain-containing protein [Akkermansiaceae bacterium]
AAPLVGLFFFIYFAVIILVIASIWKIFTKAGKPGWASIIPIYNVIVLLEIIGKPVWWIVLFLIPFVNIIISIIATNEVSKSFGRGAGTTVGLIFLPFIFYPVLAFGSAQYQGTQQA